MLMSNTESSKDEVARLTDQVGSLDLSLQKAGKRIAVLEDLLKAIRIPCLPDGRYHPGLTGSQAERIAKMIDEHIPREEPQP